ncbi:MAG: tetratricopeptide repeat protein [Verrucomicrobiota bacterium]
MNRILASFLMLVTLAASAAAEPMPIDPLWKSENFRRAFTASYGVDARIEPRVNGEEKAVLDAVANKLANDDREGAISSLTGSSLLSESAALIFNLGNLRFEEDQPVEAIENFRKAIELYPNFRDAHRNLAVALVQNRDFDKAEPHLIRAIELGAQDGLSFGLLAYCHLNAERYAAALQAYRTAQVTMPNEVQWQMGEAECLLALDATREAEALFGHLLEKQPTEPGIWMNQANVWLQTSESRKAAANLELVRRMGELSASGLMTLGHLYLGNGLKAHGVAAWHEAMSADPPADLNSAVSALDHLTSQRHWPEADALVSKIVEAHEIAPKSEESGKLERARALIAFETGEAAAAESQIKAVIERNPLDGQALFLLARFVEKKGEREEAIMLLEQAAKDDSTALDAMLLHGQLLVESGDFEAAVEILDALQKIKPDPGIADYAEAVRSLAK